MSAVVLWIRSLKLWALSLILCTLCRAHSISYLIRVGICYLDFSVQVRGRWVHFKRGVPELEVKLATINDVLLIARFRCLHNIQMIFHEFDLL